jgi:hypothetical protein
MLRLNSAGKRSGVNHLWSNSLRKQTGKSFALNRERIRANRELPEGAAKVRQEKVSASLWQAAPVPGIARRRAPLVESRRGGATTSNRLAELLPRLTQK